MKDGTFPGGDGERAWWRRLDGAPWGTFKVSEHFAVYAYMVVGTMMFLVGGGWGWPIVLIWFPAVTFALLFHRRQQKQPGQDGAEREDAGSVGRVEGTRSDTRSSDGSGPQVSL